MFVQAVVAWLAILLLAIITGAFGQGLLSHAWANAQVTLSVGFCFPY